MGGCFFIWMASLRKKFLHTGDKASLKQCRYQHRYKKILQVGQNLPKKKQLFLPRQFYNINEQKFSDLRPYLFITFPQGFWKLKNLNIKLQEVGPKRCLNRVDKWRTKKSVKNFFRRGYLTPFKFSNLRPILFPEDSKNLKGFHIGLWEVGANRPLKGVRNTNTKKILLRKAKFSQKLTFKWQFYTFY